MIEFDIIEFEKSYFKMEWGEGLVLVWCWCAIGTVIAWLYDSIFLINLISCFWNVHYFFLIICLLLKLWEDISRGV